MENNNFEKQVQETLAGLRIEPSEKTWVGIESRIGKKEPKRRILWFFMLGLLLLGGVGYLFLMDGKSNDKNISQVEKQETRTIIKKKIPDQESLSKSNPVIDPITQKETQVHPKTTDVSSESQSPVAESLTQSTTLQEKKKEEVKNIHRNEQVILAADKGVATIPQVLVKEANVPTEQKGTIESQLLTEDRSDSKNAVAIAQKGADTSSANLISETEQLTQKQPINPQEKEESVVQENNDPGKILKAVENKTTSSSRKRWEFGVTFSAAKAYTGDGLRLGFDLDKSNMAYDPQYSLDNAVSRPGPVVEQSPVGPATTPENSIGFKGGILLKKEISPKITFVTGLGYTYYTNTILVGSEVSTDFFNSAGLLSPYRNNFHFADLPLSAQFHVNRKHKIPLDLSVGVNISRLITSDAVQYKRGNYIVDNSLFHKTQFGFNAGVSAIFFEKLSVGPFYQYGLNSLAEGGIYGKKHLNFLGLKADFIFGKNK